jgi:hypothetical protein
MLFLERFTLVLFLSKGNELLMTIKNYVIRINETVVVFETAFVILFYCSK